MWWYNGLYQNSDTVIADEPIMWRPLLIREYVKLISGSQNWFTLSYSIVQNLTTPVQNGYIKWENTLKTEIGFYIFTEKAPWKWI